MARRSRNPPAHHRRRSYGKTSTFTLTSTEQVHLPAEWNLERTKELATSDEFLPTFDQGWGQSPGGGLVTYKFRDPEMQQPGNDRVLRLKLNGVKERIGVRFRVTKNQFVIGNKAPAEDFVANVMTKPGDTGVIVSVADFLDAKKQPLPDWTNITTLSLDLMQQGKPMPLMGNSMLQSLEWAAAKAGS